MNVDFRLARRETTVAGVQIAPGTRVMIFERFVDRTRNIRISPKHHGPPDVRRFD